MGCGPSWHASRRLWDPTGREESTQVTEILVGGRDSVSSPVHRSRSLGPAVLDVAHLAKQSSSMYAGLHRDRSKQSPKRNRDTDAHTVIKGGGEEIQGAKYNSFSSTKAIYVKGKSQTSTITVRLSTDGSTLQIEQVDITHGDSDNSHETDILPMCGADMRPGDMKMVPQMLRDSRMVPQPNVNLTTGGDMCVRRTFSEPTLPRSRSVMDFNGFHPASSDDSDSTDSLNSCWDHYSPDTDMDQEQNSNRNIEDTNENKNSVCRSSGDPIMPTSDTGTTPLEKFYNGNQVEKKDNYPLCGIETIAEISG